MTPQELSDLMDEYAPRIKRILEELADLGIELGAETSIQKSTNEKGVKYIVGVNLELKFATEWMSLTKSY